MSAAAVVPNWNGRRWLPALLESLQGFDEVVVVDDGSADGSAELASSLGARVVGTGGSRRGFAAAANAGFAATACDAVALLNSDVELAPGWLERMCDGLADPAVASVACKLVRMDDPAVIDDAGDRLRRDGVCEQRGRGRRDDGRFDEPGEAWGACAAAALYRRGAVLAVGGFDERFGAYLEDVDLALRLRLAGWRCAYVPAVARHAGGGSAAGLPAPVERLVARNTLLLVAKHFPLRWAGPVAYRQAAWLAGGPARTARLRGLAEAFPLLGAMRRSRPRGAVAISDAVPAVPWRGPRAGGHPRSPQ